MPVRSQRWRITLPGKSGWQFNPGANRGAAKGEFLDGGDGIAGAQSRSIPPAWRSR